ncbi:membrane protein [Mesobacillus campisalis]|uniref:Membrane protein n=1 Tax=Mesobacillus campisalis TaxID=1408103 RepID=A0A0M2SZZ7_9BACI|nr:membrane protein [Mesobacillus campisalis]
MLRVNKFALSCMLVALTAIGSMMKVPAIIGSIALDAFPSLLAAAMLGGPSGAVVGMLGHLLSAVLGGLPLGAFHILVAAEMAVLVYLFAHFYQKGKRMLAVLLFIAGNSLIAPLPFILFFGTSFYLAIVPSLIAGSILNGVLAYVLIPRLAGVLKMFKGNVETNS